MQTSVRVLFLAVAALAAGRASAETPQRVVSDVIIQGSQQVPEECIRNQLKTRIGQAYSPSVILDDVRNLYATRQFANVWADTQQDGPERVKVIFIIKDHISVVQKVEYQGNATISSDDLDGITNVRQGLVANPLANKIACAKIEQRYRDEGRPLASCTLLKGGEPGDTEVIFNITEGPSVRVGYVHFTGNTFASGDVLRKKLTLKKGGRLAEMDRAVAELVTYYRGFGYQDVKVTKELDYTANGRKVIVAFHIEEGPRYRVLAAPQVIGAKYVSKEALEALAMQKSSNYYSQAEIDKSVARMKAYSSCVGHQTKVVPETVLVPDKPGFVQVNYQLMEEPVPDRRGGQIIIVGSAPTVPATTQEEFSLPCRLVEGAVNGALLSQEK
jgi:outer membrane protein insertion porin family